jgi:hypothetical protein
MGRGRQFRFGAVAAVDTDRLPRRSERGSSDDDSWHGQQATSGSAERGATAHRLLAPREAQ